MRNAEIPADSARVALGKDFKHRNKAVQSDHFLRISEEDLQITRSKGEGNSTGQRILHSPDPLVQALHEKIKIEANP